jgi:hypothetical protein
MTDNPFHKWIAGEEWRPITAVPGYEISSIGRVRSPAGNLSLALSSGGYLFAVLPSGGKKRSFAVNRLVCEAWHGPPPSEAHQAAHLDGDRINNDPQNLAWATPAENDGHKAGHRTLLLGEKNPQARLREEDVRQIRAAIRGGETNAVIAARYGVDGSAISSIRLGKTWRHVEEANQ